MQNSAVSALGKILHAMNSPHSLNSNRVFRFVPSLC